MEARLACTLFVCLFVILYLYPVAWGPKGHGSGLAERLLSIEQLPLPKRATAERRTIRPGTSISPLAHGETKGTAGIYLRAQEAPDVHYILTAAHVLTPEAFPTNLHNPFEESVKNIPKTEIASHGKLDTLALLSNCVNVGGDAFDEQIAQNFVSLYRAGVGRSVTGRIGVDEQGWREDWALIELDKPWETTNGQWWDEGMLRLIVRSLGATDQFQPVFTSCEDPTANGLTWIKDGATTALTTGTCSGEAVELFLQGTALPVDQMSIEAGDVHPANPVSAKLLVFLQTGSVAFAAGGDSGSAVITLSADLQSLVFGGMVTSRFTPQFRGMDTMVLVAPQSAIFQQIKRNTSLNFEPSPSPPPHAHE